MSGSITLEARAKLNLYLDITGRRDDGYHLLETVMQSVTLSDIVDIRLYECGRGIKVTCSDPLLPRDEENIAGKAARLYMDEIGECAGADITIEKHIPSGAGMGGGSADAAAVLFGLNRLYGKPLTDERLSALALICGADVPFCLFGGTKLCRGIGEIMEDIAPVRDVFFLVVMPDFTCPTGAAYKKWDSAPLPIRGKLEDFLKEGIERPENMYNVFEKLYSDRRISDIRMRMLLAGAKGAMLTGSGAAVFGIFSDRETAQRAAEQFNGQFTQVCEPTERGISVL